MTLSPSVVSREEVEETRADERAEPIDLMIVGPASGTAGGIVRYVDEQRSRLPDEVSIRVHDDGSSTDLLDGSDLGVALASIRTALLFPFRRKPDVVHVHTSHGISFYRAAWFVLVTALLWRRAVVVHVHGSSFDEFVSAGGLAGAFQQLVFDRSDRVIVLSPYWADVLSERVPPPKLEILPNAVDTDEYDPEFGADPPHIAFVSHQIERKGVPELVAALERLNEEGVEFRASLAGTGSLADRSEALAESVDGVEYLGYISEDEKRRLLSEASIYVLPTHAEGLPIALLEGMAAGNAVVTTDVGSIPEVIDEETGRIVEPGDVDGLTDALRELVADPATTEAMGRRSRARAESEYSWTDVADQLTETYRTVKADARDTAPEPNRTQPSSPER